MLCATSLAQAWEMFFEALVYSVNMMRGWLRVAPSGTA